MAAFVRQPSDTTGKITMITDPISERISDLLNAGYEMLLRMLFRFFIHSGETDNEMQTICDAAVNTMFQIIKPLGLLPTTSGVIVPVEENLHQLAAALAQHIDR